MSTPSTSPAARAAGWLAVVLSATVALLALATPLVAQEPVGTIVSWHSNIPGTPWVGDGWARCNGQTVNDPASPYHGVTLPNLAGENRFLRGADTSGVLQLDAFQGHHHAVSQNASAVKTHLAEWGGDGSGQIKAAEAGVDVRHATDDGVHGEPRTSVETRPINMWVDYVIKTRPMAAVPVGAIVGWHRDLPGTPALPDCWLPCDGQLVDDPQSIYNGQQLPDLNGDGRFLRGGTPGVLEEDTFQLHYHEALHDATRIYNFGSMCVWENESVAYENATIEVLDPISDGVHGTPRLADETRPVNMSVIWVIKTKPGPSPVGAIWSWHQDLPGTPTQLPSDFVRCDGQAVADAGSPYDGQALPDLNGEGRFLRGGASSGVLQDDAFQGHRHAMQQSAHRMIGGTSISGTASSGVGYTTEPADIVIGEPIYGGWGGDPRIDHETRPKNMSVVWVLQTKTAWRDMGGAVAGYAGVPVLVGAGPLAPDEAYGLSLFRASPWSFTAHLVLGLSSLMAPFKGGILVPDPLLIAYDLPLSNGGLDISSVWPTGTPAGVTLYAQYWIPDTTVPLGFAASNGVEGTSQDP